MQEVNAAVIGLGWMGSHYAHIVKQAHNANLVAVCDRTEVTASNFGHELGVKSYTDARTMFTENKDI